MLLLLTFYSCQLICESFKFTRVKDKIRLKTDCVLKLFVFQLTQAQTGKFNVHVHVEYEWRLQNEDLDESEDEMEDKV